MQTFGATFTQESYILSNLPVKPAVMRFFFTAAICACVSQHACLCLCGLIPCLSFPWNSGQFKAMFDKS